MDYKIALIPGDGIGPEIVREAKKILDKVCLIYGHSFTYKELLLGGASIDRHGVPLTDETIADAKASDAGADGFHRRRRENFPLVSAGTLQTAGGRTFGNPESSEPVRESASRLSV